jgi:hypothetical protein
MMSPNDTFKFIRLEKLKDDGTNWVTYRERVTNTMTHKGLRRHFMGTMRKPGTMTEKDGDFYKTGDKGQKVLSEMEIEAMEKAMDEYEQKEASVREVIYETISQSMFLQIKNEPTAAKVWSKLMSIMQEKGDLIQVSILTKLQTTICLDDDDVRAHLAKMQELKEQLEGMGAPVSDPSFAAMIRKSLPASYRPLLQTLSATARVNNKTLTSDQMISAIHEEADELVVQKEADEAAENAAMIAAYAKKKGQSQKKTCTNCKRIGHTKEECFQKGGGKEGQAPWDKKKKEAAKANAASTEDTNDDVSLAVTYFPTEPLEALSAAHAANNVIIDCGATRHFTPNRSDLENFTEIEPKPIKAANGRILQATGKGDLKVTFPMGTGNKPTKATLQGVYYSPEFAFTLISVGTLDGKGFQVNFDDGICTISTPKPSRRVIGRIPLSNGLYRTSIAPKNAPASTEIAVAASKKVSISELHRQMGHVNHEDLRRMVKEGTVTGIDLDMDSKPEPCHQCIEAKATALPFPKMSTSNRAKKYGDKIVADLWGPADTASIKGRKYYLAFQDVYSHETRVYFLHRKSDAFESYKIYEAWVKLQRGAQIKIFGTDQGGEFTSAAFTKYLEKAGTVRHLTVHDSPQSNGKAERANRTIMEGARASLLAAKLPEYLWAEAANHFIWLRNRVPTKTLPDYKTPIEIATDNRPDLSNVREWGHKVWVKKTHSSKLGSKVNNGRFVGIDEESKGFRIYWEDKQSITVERNVYFDESSVLAPETTLIEGETHKDNNQLKKSPKSVDSTENATPRENEDAARKTDTTPGKSTEKSFERTQIKGNLSKTGRETTESNLPVIQTTHKPSINDPPPSNPIQASDGEEEVEAELLGRGRRARQPPGYYKDLLKGDKARGGGMTAITEEEHDYQLLTVDLDDEDLLFAGVLEDFALGTGIDGPSSLHEALKCDESHKWRAAVDAELNQIEKMGTWSIIEAPADANIVSCKYVFRLKKDEHGNIVKHKARLVARGFTQKFGIDYFDTRVWIVRWETLRNLLAQAASRGSVIHQADVKNAYLNAEIKEDIYIDLPPLYHEFRPLPPNLNNKRLVCKLAKGLYGTKQAGRGWYMKLRNTFISLGYKVCNADLGVFYRFSGTKYTIVAVATDDLTIIAESVESAQLIKTQLNEHFELVDLGEIKWLLGVHITRDYENRTILLGQQTYIDDIVKRFGLEDARPLLTPMEPGADLTPGAPHVSPIKLTARERSSYREMIGALLYCSSVTRADVAYVISTLSRYLEEPTKTHHAAVLRSIRYLKGTRDHRLVLGGKDPKLRAYSDADWASQGHRHSISGFAIFHGCGVVSWSSKKQPIVTLSSTESEYVALTHVVKDLLWHRKLHNELSPFFDSITTPIPLFCDNQGAIILSKDSTFHMRTKHIDTHFHFVRETVNNNILSISYCPTDEMIADILTKSLARFKFEKFHSLLGIH